MLHLHIIKNKRSGYDLYDFYMTFNYNVSQKYSALFLLRTPVKNKPNFNNFGMKDIDIGKILMCLLHLYVALESAKSDFFQP